MVHVVHIGDTRLQLFLGKVWEIDSGGLRKVDAVLASIAAIDPGLLGRGRSRLAEF